MSDRSISNPRAASAGGRLGVAVVGAGIAGLACARSLADRGLRVRVFDKARGPGGRTSTRREGELAFDHGAQYFTVRDDRFRQVVAGWRADGTVRRWDGRLAVISEAGTRVAGNGTDRWVGVPGMNAMARRLAGGLDVTYRSAVDPPLAGARGWRLAGDGGELGCFDGLVVSAPARQTAELLRDAAPDLAAMAAAVDMAPCWAVMAAVQAPLEVEFDGAFVDGGPLAWVARDSSKPGRPRGAETWVLHATPEWSRSHLDKRAEEVAGEMLAAFRRLVEKPVAPVHVGAHRWRYARPEQPLTEPCLADSSGTVIACGDWCGGPRVEGAFLSGVAAADRLLAGFGER